MNRWSVLLRGYATSSCYDTLTMHIMSKIVVLNDIHLSRCVHSTYHTPNKETVIGRC